MTNAQRASIQQRLLELVAEGNTKLAACRSLGINQRTVTRWAADDPEFAARYQAARIEQALSLADLAYEIANETVPTGDTAAVQRNRLRVDVIRWLTSKIAPRIFGDRVFTETTVGIGAAILLPPLRTAASDAEGPRDRDVYEAISANGNQLVRRMPDGRLIAAKP